MVISIRITPSNRPAGFIGEVTVRVSSSNPRHRPQIDVTLQDGASIARITRLGNARERGAVAGSTTLTAGAVTPNCTFERDGGLDELLLTLSASP